MDLIWLKLISVHHRLISYTPNGWRKIFTVENDAKLNQITRKQRG